MDSKKYTAKYHKNILGESWKEVKSYYSSNIKDWGGDVIAAFFTALAFAIILYIRYGSSFNWIDILISVVVGMGSVFLFRFIVSLLETPARLYMKMKDELELYKWDTVSISTQWFDLASGESGWALRIENNKKFPMLVISKPAEVSSREKVVFNEKGKWAFFKFINKKDGLTRERITSLREIKNGATQRVFPLKMQPHEQLDFVLTRRIAPEQYIYETDQDKINASPKNSVLKIKIAARVIFEDMEYDMPTKELFIRFDNDGIPKIVSVVSSKN